MADEEQDLVLEEGDGGKKKKLIIIGGGAGAVIVIGLLLFLFMGGDPEPAPAEEATAEVEAEPVREVEPDDPNAQVLYVFMRSPFLFQAPSIEGEKVIQIKVQVMVKGESNQVIAKMHTPLIENILNLTFSQANADKLRTYDGKNALKELALKNIQERMIELEGKAVVEKVIFTGFIMQDNSKAKIDA